MKFYLNEINSIEKKNRKTSEKHRKLSIKIRISLNLEIELSNSS